jgi:hypothetical protein
MDTALDLETRLRRFGEASRKADAVADSARQVRDAEIEQADLHGRSVRWIAERVGLAYSTVHTIVLARTAARQDRLRRAAGVQRDGHVDVVPGQSGGG